MSEPISENDQGKPNKEIAKGTLPANIGEVAANEPIAQKGQPHPINQKPNEPSKPWIVWRILKTPVKWWESLKSPEVSNRTIAVATVVIAVATVFTYLEVHSGSSQTDKIINADERIAAAMEGVVAQANNSLNTTIEQEHLNQRAWVAVDSIGGPVELNKPLVIDVVFRNSGRTPARNVILRTAEGWVEKGEKFTFPLKDSGQPSIGFISPNTTFHREVIATKGQVNQADIDAIKSGEYVIYTSGYITYEDIFSKSHKTTFCMFLLPDLKSYEACGEHNEGD